MGTSQTGYDGTADTKALSRAVSDFEREIEQGYRLDHKQTFAEYADYVINLKESTGTKPRTIERYRALLVRVNRAVGHMKLTDILPQHLNAFYQNLSEEGVRQDGERAFLKMDFKEWLDERGISIAEMARRTGVSQATLASAISGKAIMRPKAERVAAVMDRPLNEVFRLEKDTSPLSAKTVLEHHRLISTIMTQAEREMLIPFNPAAKATPPKVHRSAPDYYQQDEITRILEALDSAPLKWRTMTYFLIDTGCRRGECCGLKWTDFDFESGIVTIERALLYSTNLGVYEGTTKTGNSRVLALAPETLEVLQEWKAEQDSMKAAYGDAWTDTGYVFTQDNGERMNPDSLTDWLNKFSRENGLPHIHPHAFRHTAASLMIASGVDLVTAAGELGHASATTTANIYAHRIQEAREKAKNVRAGIFKRKEG